MTPSLQGGGSRLISELCLGVIMTHAHYSHSVFPMAPSDHTETVNAFRV